MTSTNKPVINVKSVGFSDTDYTIDVNGNKSTHEAPKTIDRLERLSLEKQIKKDNDEREEYDDDSDNNNKLIIGKKIELDFEIVNELDEPMKNNNNNNLLEGIEILEL